MEKYQHYILPSLPLIASVFSILFSPLPGFRIIPTDFKALVILYVFTLIYAKVRCSRIPFKTYFTKSLIPLSLFIGLTVFSFISAFIKNPYIIGIGVLATNMFVWLGLGFLFYKPVFNAVFEEGKC